MIIWNNFKASYLKIGTKKTATQPFTPSYNKIHQPSHKTATQPKIKPFQAILAPSASPM